MLEHYGIVADPARVRDPNRKGVPVENAIQHTQNTALTGRRFESIEAQNEFLMHWEENWAAKRIHGSARRQVEAMFQEEKPHPRHTQLGSLELPESERPFNPSRQTGLALASASDIGPQAKALCQHLFDAEGRVGHRGMWGIVALAKKYPARLVEQACDHALRHHLSHLSIATGRYAPSSSGCSSRRWSAWSMRPSWPCRLPRSIP